MCACLAATICVGSSAGKALTERPRSNAGPRPSVPVPSSARPNIVFVLTDDLSLDLLPYMPHVQAMQQDGLTFTNYFVSDSLCCPSRASILTGEFPHDTRVFGNFGRTGGFRQFYARGEERNTFAVALQAAGYQTAMMGKYLNGYMDVARHARDGATARIRRTYVPPGWSEWDVAGWGYPEFDYTLNENGTLHHFGRGPDDYLTDVLEMKGTEFIARAARSHQPFFLELATFAPHSPYVPAPRDRKDFPGLLAPRPPSFDVLPTNPPRWLEKHPALSAKRLARIDRAFRRRVQSVQAVDRMIGQIEATLQAQGLSNDTYIVFSSDNGLHMGEYRLMPGKLTAFDTDIHVPLIITGPGVPAGASTDVMAENIDLAETFAAIGGTVLAGDGRSLMPLLDGENPADWRNAILVEHRGPKPSILDPDFQRRDSGNPTTYEAMRTQDFLYVEYADGELEFYDLRADPFELHNIAAQLMPAQLARLHRALAAMMKRCHGAAACWSVMHVPPGVG